MTDWTNIPDQTFEADRPVLGSTHLAIVKNFEALAEGAAGAPQLYLRSLERLEAGDQIRSRNDTTVTLASDPITQTLHSFAFIQYGEIRARVEKTTSAGTVQINRIRNGNTTTLASAGPGETGFLIADVGVLPGDTVAIVLIGASALNVTGRNARFSTSGQDLWPGSSARLEGNRAAT